MNISFRFGLLQCGAEVGLLVVVVFDERFHVFWHVDYSTKLQFFDVIDCLAELLVIVIVEIVRNWSFVMLSYLFHQVIAFVKIRVQAFGN